MSYQPHKSTVTDITLVKFLRGDLEYNLETIPGIGPKAKERFAENGIHNSFQLLAKFLSMKQTDGDDCVAHCTQFYNWLGEIKLNTNRHSITKSVAEKLSISFPNLYQESQFDEMVTEC